MSPRMKSIKRNTSVLFSHVSLWKRDLAGFICINDKGVGVSLC